MGVKELFILIIIFSGCSSVNSEHKESPQTKSPSINETAHYFNEDLLIKLKKNKIYIYDSDTVFSKMIDGQLISLLNNRLIIKGANGVEKVYEIGKNLAVRELESLKLSIYNNQIALSSNLRVLVLEKSGFKRYDSSDFLDSLFDSNFELFLSAIGYSIASNHKIKDISIEYKVNVNSIDWEDVIIFSDTISLIE